METVKKEMDNRSIFMTLHMTLSADPKSEIVHNWMFEIGGIPIPVSLFKPTFTWRNFDEKDNYIITTFKYFHQVFVCLFVSHIGDDLLIVYMKSERDRAMVSISFNNTLCFFIQLCGRFLVVSHSGRKGTMGCLLH